ncbi:hypothetical protein BN1013_01416 [Candidatus Rubidus massiliensis]|nr:MAG: hypothetical protein BGO10_04470 [Chlamydia sp. 32-24]CDZ80891.1 hypothetical protein BN1013_01416 [Candidatus Rubidus massiliensis]
MQAVTIGTSQNVHLPFQTRSKQEIESSLLQILKEIEIQKEKKISKANIIKLTLKEYFFEFKEKPFINLFKTTLVVVAVAMWHPLFVGSVACFNAYLGPWEKVFTGTEEGYHESQIVSNLGHFAGYIAEGIAINAGALGFAFWPAYKKAYYFQIEEIYDFFLSNSNLKTEEKDLLYDRKRQELAALNLLTHSFLEHASKKIRQLDP